MDDVWSIMHICTGIAICRLLASGHAQPGSSPQHPNSLMYLALKKHCAELQSTQISTKQQEHAEGSADHEKGKGIAGEIADHDHGQIPEQENWCKYYLGDQIIQQGTDVAAVP